MAVRKNVKSDMEPTQFLKSSSDTLKTVQEKEFGLRMIFANKS